MSRFAHHVQPDQAGASREEFALVHARYTAIPALLWAAAVVAALLVTVVQEASVQVAGPGSLPGSSAWGA